MNADGSNSLKFEGFAASADHLLPEVLVEVPEAELCDDAILRRNLG